MSPPAPEFLSRILCPATPGTFLLHYEARQQLLIAGRSACHYSDILTFDMLDLLLQSEGLPYAFFNVIRDGVRVPIEDWSRVVPSVRGEQRLALPDRLASLYSAGATIVLNDAPRQIRSLRVACRALSDETGFQVHANVYMTPRRSGGFRRHTDDHEVLVLQIAGAKRWTIHPDSGPAETFQLQAGDLFYLPGGLAHEAVAQESASVHVTLGLRPHYGYHVIDELAALAEKENVFCRPAPPRFAPPDAHEAFASAVASGIGELLARFSPAALIERRQRGVADDGPNQGRRFSELHRIGGMTLDTVVRRRPGICVSIDEDDRVLTVGFEGKALQTPVFLREAVEKILGGTTFSVGSLEGFLADSGKVKLAGQFVEAGLLEIQKV